FTAFVRVPARTAGHDEGQTDARGRQREQQKKSAANVCAMPSWNSLRAVSRAFQSHGAPATMATNTGVAASTRAAAPLSLPPRGRMSTDPSAGKYGSNDTRPLAGRL